MCAYSPHEKNLVNPNSRTKYLERKSSQEIVPDIILVQKQSEMTHSQKYCFIKQCSESEQNTKEERKACLHYGIRVKLLRKARRAMRLTRTKQLGAQWLGEHLV